MQWGCHARSAHAVRSFECRPILRPYFWPLLTSFWFHTGFFFSFLCIWDVAHLNCHPLLPNVNHFYPFSIPHIELSPLWGPREGRGDVAIHSPRTLRSLWYGLHPHHITDLARHQQVCRVHAHVVPTQCNNLALTVGEQIQWLCWRLKNSWRGMGGGRRRLGYGTSPKQGVPPMSNECHVQRTLPFGPYFLGPN